MSALEPKRWLESAELDRSLRSLIETHDMSRPTKAARARMWERLSPRLSAGTAPPAVAHGAAAALQHLARIKLALKLGVGALVLTAVSLPPSAAERPRAARSEPASAVADSKGAPLASVEPAPAECCSVGSEAANVAAASAGAAEHAADSLGPKPVERSPERPATQLGRLAARRASKTPATALPDVTPTRAPARSSSLADELALLARARRVVSTDPARALQLTVEHGQRYRDGLLAQEREVLAIDALWRLGQRELARARAKRFMNGRPGSAHAVRLSKVLESP